MDTTETSEQAALRNLPFLAPIPLLHFQPKCTRDKGTGHVKLTLVEMIWRIWKAAVSWYKPASYCTWHLTAASGRAPATFSLVWCYRWMSRAEPSGGKDQRRFNIRSWMNTHTSHDLKYRSYWEVASVYHSQQQGPNTDGYRHFGGLRVAHTHLNLNLRLAPCQPLGGKRSKFFYTIGGDLFRNGWLIAIREAWILLLPILPMDVQFTRPANSAPKTTGIRAPGSGSPFPSWSANRLEVRAFTVSV